MCPIDDNKVKAGSLGIMEIIKATMERHASSEQVSAMGLGALRNVCVNGTCVESKLKSYDAGPYAAKFMLCVVLCCSVKRSARSWCGLVRSARSFNDCNVM